MVSPASFASLKMPFQSGGSCPSPTFQHYGQNWSTVAQGRSLCRPGPSMQSYHNQGDYDLKCKPDGLQGVLYPRAPLLAFYSPHPIPTLPWSPPLPPAAVSTEAGPRTRLCRPHLSPWGVSSTDRPLERPPDHISQEMVTVAAVTRAV